jgi:hypothetical protein
MADKYALWEHRVASPAGSGFEIGTGHYTDRQSLEGRAQGSSSGLYGGGFSLTAGPQAMLDMNGVSVAPGRYCQGQHGERVRPAGHSTYNRFASGRERATVQ